MIPNNILPALIPYNLISIPFFIRFGPAVDREQNEGFDPDVPAVFQSQRWP